jgi:hypothetical protein
LAVGATVVVAGALVVGTVVGVMVGVVVGVVVGVLVDAAAFATRAPAVRGVPAVLCDGPSAALWVGWDSSVLVGVVAVVGSGAANNADGLTGAPSNAAVNSAPKPRTAQPLRTATMRTTRRRRPLAS